MIVFAFRMGRASRSPCGLRNDSDRANNSWDRIECSNRGLGCRQLMHCHREQRAWAGNREVAEVDAAAENRERVEVPFTLWSENGEGLRRFKG